MGRFGPRFRRWRLWRIDFFLCLRGKGEGGEGGKGGGDTIPTVEFELI